VSDHLLRAHAPITDEGWQRIDDEARERLTPGLAARRLVDFKGPLGWDYSATNLGRVDGIDAGPLGGVEGRRRRVLPLVELRTGFRVSREELRAGDRGAEDVDFDDLDAAVQRMVLAENTAVFHGWPDAGIAGIAPSSPHEPIPCGDAIERYPSHVAGAVEVLLRNGISGPYGVALGRDEYRRVIETAEHGGYPLLDHLRKILGGPIVWAPGVVGGVVVSLRGGDFLYECGQDLAVGYDAHDGDAVSLYLEESFSFRIATPEAAVAITP
jgi:uncharacterized linocin/CFP29 family protein